MAAHLARHSMLAALSLPLLLVVAACSSGVATTQGPATPGVPGATSAGAQGASSAPGGGSALGFDCAAVLSPAELDAAAGLQGGTVKTTRRGDQPGAGEVAGVTECAIEIPTVSTWFGHIHISIGADALSNFDASWDFAKQQGAAPMSGVGTEALLKSDEMGVNGWARDGSGASVEVGVAWDEESTTEDKVKDAVRQILITVLSRT